MKINQRSLGLKSTVIAVGMSMLSGFAKAETETFFTFDEPNYQLSGCVDIATLVDITDMNNKFKVTLTNKNLGNCEIAVPENKRSFIAKKQSNRCGQVVYKGKGRAGKAAVTVYDNRANVCHHLGIGVEVRETLETGETSATYSSSSYDARGEHVIKVGVLETVFGIGGESYGYAVDGVEIDFFKNGLDGQAQQLVGMKVVVKGYLQQVAGIEIAERTVLTAESIEPQYDYHSL